MAERCDRDLEAKLKLLQKENEEIRNRCCQSEKEAHLLEASLEEYDKVIADLAKSGVGHSNEEQLKNCKNQLIELEASIKETQKIHENELPAKDSEIQALKSKLEEAKGKACEQEISKVNDNFQNELAALYEKTDDLNEKVKFSQDKLFFKTKENIALCEKLKDVENEAEQYRELFNSRNSRLEELNVLVKQLNDDYLFLKSAHNLAENTAMDAKNQGNSLFAEVDTKRVELHENIQTIKSQYLIMKKQGSSYVKELAELRKINVVLKNQLSKIEDGQNYQQERKKSLLKQEVQILKMLIESYGKELKTVSSSKTLELSGLDLAEFLAAQKTEDLRGLNAELHREVTKNVLTMFDVTDHEKQLRKKDLKIAQLKGRESELKEELNGLKIKLDALSLLSDQTNNSENTPPEEINKLKSIMKTE